MRIENVMVAGFEPAMRDMRNPLESWEKSDSQFFGPGAGGVFVLFGQDCWSTANIGIIPERPVLGEDDLKLACKLVAAGGSHRKFLREIVVWCRLTLPRSVWQEVDTYKVSTVRNSCSTMYKLGSRDLIPEDFADGDVIPGVLEELNAMGECYREKRTYECPRTGAIYEGVDLLRHMKNNLPEGYLQTAGYVFNYETGIRMYADRKSHRMKEWSGSQGICHAISRLPYMQRFLDAAKVLKDEHRP